MNKNQKGFTLIELMIVVAIIGILAAVAIPKFAEMMERSRDGATKGNIGALKSAISIYYGDHEGTYPTDLTAIYPTGTTAWNFLGKYIDTIPNIQSRGGNKLNTVANTNSDPWGKGGNSADFIYEDSAWNLGSATSSDSPALGSGDMNLSTVNIVGHGYKYESATGLVFVNCTLLDMNSLPYTLFGYN
jgi:prepilin-type N-terminal cleavage/methylation domain-containing protein